MAEKLTVKQRRFVDVYCGNATRAAIAAGYSEKTAPFIGAENLKKPKILAENRSREVKRCASTIATREERQAFWSAIMRDKSEKTQDRLKASELLGKSEADFIDRQELTGMNGGPLLPEPVVVHFVDCTNDDDPDSEGVSRIISPGAV